jgi:hypothetical protein
MLQGGKVKYIVIARAVFYEGIEYIRTAVNSEGLKLTVNIAEGTTDIPNQLYHVVFADVYHMKQAGATLEDFPNHCRADRTGAAYDQESGGGYKAGQLCFAGSYVRGE